MAVGTLCAGCELTYQFGGYTVTSLSSSEIRFSGGWIKFFLGFGIDNDFNTVKRLAVGPWYNAPGDDPRSCRRLDAVATEFWCQGLELDLAIVAWGSDYARCDGSWSTKRSRGTRDVENPFRLRQNA